MKILGSRFRHRVICNPLPRLSQEFLQRLTMVLRQYPPPQPKKPAVDLLVAVGDQQQYLDLHGLLPPHGSDGALDALQVISLPQRVQKCRTRSPHPRLG